MLPFLICLKIFPQLLNNNLLGLHIIAVDGGRDVVGKRDVRTVGDCVV